MVGPEQLRRVGLRGIAALLGQRDLGLLVGLVMTLALDRAPARCVPARGGQLQRRFRGELPQRLNQPLPEALITKLVKARLAENEAKAKKP